MIIFLALISLSSFTKFINIDGKFQGRSWKTYVQNLKSIFHFNLVYTIFMHIKNISNAVESFINNKNVFLLLLFLGLKRNQCN